MGPVPMNLSTLISTLTGLDAFCGRVAVASDVKAAVDAIAPFHAMPCCVVHDLRETASPNEMGVGGSPRHTVTVRIGLLIVARDVSDAIGAAALSQIDTARSSVTSALLGLVPDTGYHPIEYGTGRIAFAEGGTLMWLDEYLTRYLLT